MSPKGTWEDQLVGTLKGVACGLYEWLIPIGIAVAVRLYTGKGTNLRQTPTDALTGFRIISATLIVIEHSDKRLFLNGAGVFLVLSGCVISFSRCKEPGHLKSTFTSVQEACKFIFVRLLRVVPLWWVYYAMFEIDMDHVCFDIASPVQFLAQVLLNLAKLFFTRPWDLFRWGDSPVEHINLWFVKTIAMLYILYPVLELVLFGRAGQITRRKIAVVVAVCVVVKLAIYCFALWAFQVGREGHGLWSKIELDGIWPCPWVPWYLEIPWGLTGPIPRRQGGLEDPDGACSVDWYRNVFTRMPEFVLGMLIPHVGFQSDALVTCSDVAALLVFLLTFFKPDESTIPLQTARKMHLYMPFTLLIIWGMCFGPRQSRFGKILCTPCFVAAGNFAYGVYVWQDPLKLRYMPQGRSLKWWSASFPFYLMFLYTVAWTTHRVVEEPASDLARYLMGKASNRAPPAEPQGSPREGRARLLETEGETSSASDDTGSDSSSESSGGQVCCKTMTS